MRPETLLPLILAALLPLSGCLGGEAPAEVATPAATPAPAPLGTPLTTEETTALAEDAWEGATERVLLDKDVTTEVCHGIPPTPSLSCATIPLRKGQAVLQGTETLTFTATWSDTTSPQFHLRYRDAASDHVEPIPLTSGAPVVIPVTAATADAPGAEESRWAFRLDPGTTERGGAARSTSVHVTILITKAAGPLTVPAVPDFWGGATRLALGNVTGIAEGSKPLTFLGTVEPHLIPLPEGSIVPPGTGSLTVNVTWEVVDPMPGVDYHVTPYARTPANGQITRLEDVTGGVNGAPFTFTLPLRHDQWDSPLAEASAWAFHLHQFQAPAGTEATLATGYPAGVGLERDVRYTFEYVAHRAAPDGDQG